LPSSTPVYALPYPLPTDQVSEGANDIKALADRLEAVLGTTVAAIPPGAIDGQRLALEVHGGTVGDPSVWSFVFKSGYWLFTGGAAVIVRDDATILTPGAYTAMGPNIALPALGIYDLAYGCRFSDQAAGWMAPHCGASGWDPQDAVAYAATAHTGYGGGEPLAAAASNGCYTGWISGTLYSAYRGGANASYRWLRVLPLTLAAAGMTLDDVLDDAAPKPVPGPEPKA